MTNKFLRDDGQFVSLASAGSSATGPITLLTNSSTANVALSSTATTFTGPSVAQGSSGIWYVSGNVTFSDSATPSQIFAKLWDGTTVIDSAAGRISAAATSLTLSLSGYISSPAGNLSIAFYANSTTAGMHFNDSGYSKDSTITAIRIG